MSRVLIVEDEEHLARGLQFNLQAEGMEADVVGDGEEALKLLLPADNSIDAVIIDVMLPGITGFEVVTQLRNAKQYVPVLMLTARGRPEDVLHGFESGVDDYLAKPFAARELLARIKAVLRRTRMLPPNLQVTEVGQLPQLEGNYGRLRAVRAGGDGALYVTTSNGDNDKVLRVAPTGS